MNTMDLNKYIEELADSIEYKNYLEAREKVLLMIEEWSYKNNLPSKYWEEELSGFDYILDASPLVIHKLREHCYHLTGLRSYEYRDHHYIKSSPFASKLAALRQQDKSELFMPESPALGGFGHSINGELINLDTLKFYESLIALDSADLLNQFRICQRRKSVLEIGAGWGGFAYQFKTLYPDVCYIIIDLPQTLLYSIVYLKTLFPDAMCLIYGDKSEKGLPDAYEKYDFIFLPHFYWSDIRPSKIDLAINIASFQEMTTEQVDSYIKRLSEIGCSDVYSHNRDCSPYNVQLSAVGTVIEKYANVREVKVLDLQYNYLKASSVPRNQKPLHKYRHLVGSFKK